MAEKALKLLNLILLLILYLTSSILTSQSTYALKNYLIESLVGPSKYFL